MEVEEKNINQRKYFIDNLRWACILLLIPFHTAMAWNCWGEGNYVWFEGNRWFSSAIIFISPWYMSLLFVLAGISARYSMQRRTTKQFVRERFLKLLLPLVTGMVTVVPYMTYLADKFQNGYNGNFFEHYSVYFTTFTDLTGYDGGWTPAHLWFLLFLYLISLLGLGIITLLKKFAPKFSLKELPIVVIYMFALLPWMTSIILNFGGKSIGSYLMLFLFGYYLVFEETVMTKIVKYRWISLCIMLIADVLDIYMFIWAENSNSILNGLVMYITCWFGVLTLLGFAKNHFNQNNRVTRYLTTHSFMFYIFHFVWILIFQYYLSFQTKNVAILYVVPVFGAFIMTFLTVEVVRRIPIINLLFGCKEKKKVEREKIAS